jgi:hypothetical protein
MNNDEKFISIEYETWKNKYLPLEEKVNYLKRQLKIKEDENTINIKLYAHPVDRGHIGYREPIYHLGYLKIDNNGLARLEKEKFSFHRLLSDISIGTKFMSEEEAKRYIEETEKLNQAGDKLLLDIALKTKENQEKIAKIPKIIKWLFRIKE